MRRLAVVLPALLVVLGLAGCGGFDRAESARIGRDARVYVELVPRRAVMTPDQLAVHDQLGASIVSALEAGGQ